ncbi:hypothetical protein OH76DRAFT_1200441 [Lentinus brumalis]|uniref:Uncharacterized protein n=1 Tax=Lentinus brumalis TaxID=2498619 RepID=A0A371CT71_9APHY|nr:hypothetical protein OH76DRAFT_1200441 [Polyporus brumalis]
MCVVRSIRVFEVRPPSPAHGSARSPRSPAHHYLVLVSPRPKAAHDPTREFKRTSSSTTAGGRDLPRSRTRPSYPCPCPRPTATVTRAGSSTRTSAIHSGAASLLMPKASLEAGTHRPLTAHTRHDMHC